MSNVISSPYTDCGNFGRLFGGYGKFGNYNQVSKTYVWTNRAHYGLLVNIKFLQIDTWDSVDWLDVYVNGVKQQRITNSNYDGTSSQCGNSGAYDRIINLSYTIGSHTSNSVEIKFISNLDEVTTNESWGIREIYIYLKMCDTSCLSCSGGSSSECTSCHINAYLSNGVCTCANYYYLKDASIPCGSNPCASCTRCNISCRTCDGPSSLNCLSCESQDVYSNSLKTCSYPQSNEYILFF